MHGHDNQLLTLGMECPPGSGWTPGGKTGQEVLGDAPGTVEDLLRCVACRARLFRGEGELVCANPACGARYPIVDNLPVLINDDESLFAREDFVGRRNTTIELSRPGFKRWVDNLLPVLGRNLKARHNYQRLAGLLLERTREPVVLVIGGSVLGQGMEGLVSRPGIRLVETDVTFGPRTQIICDANSLPFDDNFFDGVVIQAVLQYVPDPVRCVQEIERVLKPRGLVYAEVAFMQQVVHGRFDFTRFTHLGLRRLFRRFRELQSGPMAGPGMALAWACHFFLLSFATRKFARALIHAAARLAFFWLKYFDVFLLQKPGTYDAASGYFFLGELAGRCLPDRQLIALYRGAQ
ncbi:MAG TPA: methyltransferase domain-containing protein [Candidatus Paceibacterota bacterium]|nr:methyltransferase domain-containing protein [Verrucomicrobiota bacterium]HSA08828.1 methyltransferase domain-containing protein [Candidatus Paceibacterota bacterium]